MALEGEMISSERVKEDLEEKEKVKEEDLDSEKEEVSESLTTTDPTDMASHKVLFEKEIFVKTHYN